MKGGRKVKIYISVDMEGISGLVDQTHVDSRMHNYERGRRIMTDEANAVITAAFEAGCTDILVNDSHSQMNNLMIELLHPDTSLITGGAKPFSMVQGLDESFSGAFFIGYHARASKKGVLSHSMTFGVRNMYINDMAVGEMGFNALVAGFYGVPVLMVSGDDQAAIEANELIPEVKTAIVKEAITRSVAKSLTPKKAADLLARQTLSALSNRSIVKPLIPPENPILRIEFANYGQAEWASTMPGTILEPDSTTVRFDAEDILEAYRAMIVMTELAMKTTFC
nr:M55 family metallopeptidase [Rossellomorea marisflavi]